uniref:E3 ubiquitin-protein ligase RING1-like n=1 Tax=Rhizophora mucronata TaxID=61149 RepID=A0A2P2JVX6_RHIMU
MLRDCIKKTAQDKIKKHYWHAHMCTSKDCKVKRNLGFASSPCFVGTYLLQILHKPLPSKSYFNSYPFKHGSQIMGYIEHIDKGYLEP